MYGLKFVVLLVISAFVVSSDIYGCPAAQSDSDQVTVTRVRHVHHQKRNRVHHHRTTVVSRTYAGCAGGAGSAGGVGVTVIVGASASNGGTGSNGGAGSAGRVGRYSRRDEYGSRSLPPESRSEPKEPPVEINPEPPRPNDRVYPN